VLDDASQLAARANWCRRLARDCHDHHTRAALEELARDCERRVRDAKRVARSDQL
jgi:hypothetical protein